MKCLNGDLNQMYTQMDFLRGRGISVTVKGGITMVKSEDYEYCIMEIYANGIIGWWNYKDDLVSFGICTGEQFTERLTQRVERNKEG